MNLTPRKTQIRFSSAATPGHTPSYPATVEPHRCGDGRRPGHLTTLAPVKLERLGLSPSSLEGRLGRCRLHPLQFRDRSSIQKMIPYMMKIVRSCLPVPTETHNASPSISAESRTWNCIVPNRCRVLRVVSYCFINQNRPGWPGLLAPEPLKIGLSLSHPNTYTDRLALDPLASLCQSFPAHTIITERTKNILHRIAFDQLEHILPDPKSGSSPLTSTDALAADTFFLHLCTPLALYLPASHHFGSGGELYPGLYASHWQHVFNSLFATMWPVLMRQRVIWEHPPGVSSFSTTLSSLESGLPLLKSGSSRFCRTYRHGHWDYKGHDQKR